VYIFVDHSDNKILYFRYVYVPYIIVFVQAFDFCRSNVIFFYSNQYLYEVMVYEKVRFFFEHIFLYIRLSEEINIRRDAFCFRTMSDYYIIKVVYYANTFVKENVKFKRFFDKWNFLVKKDKINLIERYHFCTEFIMIII